MGRLWTKFARLLAAGQILAQAAIAEDQARSSLEATASLKALIESDARPESHRARDKWRHPLETLSFFGIEPSMTVVEIWPGGQGGYYRRILAPFLEAGGGRYVPVTDDSPFPGDVPGLPHGETDMVLVFRAHGFMIYDHDAQLYVDALYRMLKPGGIFGIVDHAGDERVPQDPEGRNGYVNESHFLGLARNAGFELIESSDVNRNPKDGKDHPRGVYSLPPTLAGSLPFTDERQKYLEIGESDRFTLKFRKPFKTQQ